MSYKQVNQSGFSIVATVLVLMALALFAAVAVSLVITGTGVGIQEEDGDAAFYIAEGGIHYAIKKNVFPNYSTAGSTVTLGRGGFELVTPAYLTQAVALSATTINVNSTTGFPSSGKILIDSEVMTYTAKDANTFTLSSGAEQPHAQYNSVYPATVLNGALNNSITTITVNDTTGFLVPGLITIDSELTWPGGSPVRTASEHIYCTGKTTTTFTNCERGYNGTLADAHSSGTNVFQYVFRSKGLITSNPLANPTQRVISANMTPRTRKSAIGWTWPPSKEWTLAAFAIKPAGGDSIAYDSSAYATFSRTSNAPYQWSHTVGVSGTFLYTGLAFSQVGSSALNYATAVTYAGQPLTLLGRQAHPTNYVSVEIWYWDSTISGNLPTGTNTMVVTVANPNGGGYQFGLIGGSASFTGTAADPIIDASANFAHGTGTYATVNVTISTPNSWILDSLSQLKTPNTRPISPQTAYPNWGQNQQATQTEGALGAGSYISSNSLFTGTANNMKVTISEQY